MKVNISATEISRGYQVTVNEKVVTTPHTFTTEEVPAIVGIIHSIGEASPNVQVVVSYNDNTWFVNGDELKKTRNVSILEFSE